MSVIVICFVIMLLLHRNISSYLTSRQAENLCILLIKKKINNNFYYIKTKPQNSFFSKTLSVNIEALDINNIITKGNCVLDKYYTNNKIHLVNLRLQNSNGLYLYNNVNVDLIKDF
ncbi:hypothetical protein ACFX5K_06055 [Rickettsiales bacterium LUAb2]